MQLAGGEMFCKNIRPLPVKCFWKLALSMWLLNHFETRRIFYSGPKGWLFFQVGLKFCRLDAAM